jgi:hypothetical protein
MVRYMVALSLAVLASRAVSAQTPLLELRFAPQDERFAAAAAEYRDIWTAEGPGIVAAMERRTGLRFPRTPVDVVVLEAPSFSGDSDSPMRMRASYPASTKRATLVHELGHRLITGIVERDADEHPTVFLFVYDVWVELWGREFADEQVAIEGRRGGEYPTAWRDALAIDADERARRLRALVERRRPH